MESPLERNKPGLDGHSQIDSKPPVKATESKHKPEPAAKVRALSSEAVFPNVQSKKRPVSKKGPVSSQDKPAKHKIEKKISGGTSTVQNSHNSHRNKPIEKSGHSLFVPVFIMLTAVLVVISGTLLQNVEQRRLIQKQLEQQNISIKEAKKVRIQLESIARQTYQLSVNGNKHASDIVSKMKNTGFVFNNSK